MPQVPDVPLQGLYGDLILDHYRNPRNRRPVPDPDAEAEEFNPFCGDRVSVLFTLDGRGRVSQVGARAEGCSIIQASASMMGDQLAGKSLEELEALSQHFRDMMLGKIAPGPETDDLGELTALQVVRQFPVRIKCALLPWTALEEAIAALRARDQ